MKRLFFLFVLCTAGQILAKDNTAEMPKDLNVKTASVALFKNGLAVVRQEADITAEVVYRWCEVPQAVHGTFFAESDLNIEIRSTRQEVKTPLDSRTVPNFADLNRKNVIVGFENKSSLKGEIAAPPETSPSNSLLSDTAFSQRYTVYAAPMVPTDSSSSPILLKCDDGRFIFLTGKDIVSIETAEPLKERTENKPVMLFNVKANGGKTSGKIQLFYLVKGAAWSPSYRINLLDNKKLSIEQTAQIRSELPPIDNAEISLVSGYPQIETSQVRSLLHPSQVLAQFFQQLNQPLRYGGYSGNDYMSNSVMVQQAAGPSYTFNPDFDITAGASGEGPDIHYQSIGKRTLNTGDTLSLSTGKGEAEYQRVLECSISHHFTEHNNYNNNQDKPHTDVYDVVKFKNPLPFPMTTAPASVTENGRFLGQNKSYWVNPSQIASVKITKVMNVSVNYKEAFNEEVIKNNDGMIFFNRRYFQRPLTGTFEIYNQRNENITLSIDTVFYGQIDKVDVEPLKKTLNTNTNSSGSPNDSTALLWTLQLKASEKKTFTISGKRWYTN